jgi:uncharacterized protein (DUF2461 family)
MSTEYKLKKSPQGYEVTHPAIDLLRHKNFTIGHSLLDDELKDTGLHHTLTKHFTSLHKFNSFLRTASK